MAKSRFAGIIRSIKILGHTCLVLFFMLFPVAIFYQTESKIPDPVTPFQSPYYWNFFVAFLAFFYGYTYYLIPRFFLKRQFWSFWSLLFLLFCIFYLLKPTDQYFAHVLLPLKGLKPPPKNPYSLDFISFVLFMMLAAIGLTIQIIRQWQLSEKRALQAETDKANAELSFLKAQINPHFLFNTLNTIYTLILTQNEKAGDAVLKLSNIMRYATDDAAANFVCLEKEVDSIKDFISLQRLQQGKKMNVDFSVSGNLENKQIAPLILLTYIENAFKYGVSSHVEATITIKITVESDNIIFLCQNSIFTKPGVMESTGIGLLNTQKRLEFLYPEKHDLKITCTENLYIVNLTLNLVA